MITKIARIITSGLVGLVEGGALATFGENILNNEPLREAITKPETLYFAGAFAIGRALYQATCETTNKNRLQAY